MGCGSSGAPKAANAQYTKWENAARGNYNTAMNNYNSDVSRMEANPNPFSSKSYIQNQNKLTSAAMNSEDNAARQALQDTSLRTGENPAALDRTIEAGARAGQRTLDKYNAKRNTQNLRDNLAYQQQLARDRMAGAQSEAGMFRANESGRSNALSNITEEKRLQDAMLGRVVGGATGAVGSIFAGKG